MTKFDNCLHLLRATLNFNQSEFTRNHAFCSQMNDLPDIGNFAHLRDQLFNRDFGVVYASRNTRHLRVSTATYGQGMQVGTATAELTNHAINGTWPLKDRNYQRVRAGSARGRVRLSWARHCLLLRA